MSGRGIGARRLEPAAIAGVMSREVANFRTFWKATTFSSVLEPTIYLLAFGLGLGATLVSKVDGLDYVEFVGTGMVATAVIFSSALPAMFGTFVKHRFQNTYDAILAAPVDVEELVTAEMLWIGLRAGFYGCFPLSPPRSLLMAVTTPPVPSRLTVSGSHLTLCEITIRLIYLSCAQMDRACARSPPTPNRTGSRTGSRKFFSCCQVPNGGRTDEARNSAV